MLYTLLMVHLLALISPGADFLFVLSSAVTRSKKEAMLAALGVSISILAWSCLVIMGIGGIVERYPLLKYILSISGIGYLFYLSYQLFVSRKQTLNQISNKQTNPFWGGIVVNLSNPKAFFYFTSIFSLILTSGNIGYFLKSIAIILVWLESLLWFSLVALFFNKKTIRLLYEKYLPIIHIFLAILLILCALSILVKVFT